MYNLARGLVSFGHQVTVITHDQNPSQLQGVNIDSVPIAKSPLPFIAKIKRRGNRLLRGIVHPWSWQALEKFRDLNFKQQFNIIETAEFGAWGYHFAQNKKVPFVVRCHNPTHGVWAINQPNWVHAWPFPASLQKQDVLERKQTALADGIAAPSEALAYHLSLNWVIPLNKFTVIPNLIDAELFCPNWENSVKNEVLYVGRLELNKGVYDLAQALPAILEEYPSITVRFVGMDRPVVETYSTLGSTASQAILGIIPHKYHARIFFTAPVPVSEIVKFQQQSLCAVMPTRGFESFSYTVLEPMACGTPVIATRCGGPTEIITHGVDGLLIPPGSPESLQDALRLLIGNSEIRASLSHSARKTVEDRFSSPVVIPQITNWYEDVVNKFKNTAHE
jgi:glycosyltransferase involved in cell wall biosynthesis